MVGKENALVFRDRNATNSVQPESNHNHVSLPLNDLTNQTLNEPVEPKKRGRRRLPRDENDNIIPQNKSKKQKT